MFVKKGEKGAGQFRTYTVSPPLVTTQHKYEDLVDEDLIRQLKIQAAIAEWQIGDTSPSPAMIDKKKHVVDDIKASRKKQKKEKKSKKEKKEQQDDNSEEKNNEEKDQDKEKKGRRKRANTGDSEMGMTITHSAETAGTSPPSAVVANSPLRGSGHHSLIKRATALGTMTRRKGRDRSRTEANITLSDPAGIPRVVPITQSDCSLRDDDEEVEEDTASALTTSDPKKKSKSFEGKEFAEVIKMNKNNPSFKSLGEKDLVNAIKKVHAAGGLPSSQSDVPPRDRRLSFLKQSSDTHVQYVVPLFFIEKARTKNETRKEGNENAREKEKKKKILICFLQFRSSLSSPIANEKQSSWFHSCQLR